jgi:hypothetical protein
MRSVVPISPIAAVEKEIGPGWTVVLTRRHLTAYRLTRIKMRPNTIRKLYASQVARGVGHHLTTDPELSNRR